jgi:hypothetical protein
MVPTATACNFVRFQVFTEVIMKSTTFFWDVTPCSLVEEGKLLLDYISSNHRSTIQSTTRAQKYIYSNRDKKQIWYKIKCIKFQTSVFTVKYLNILYDT